jgi:spore coat protein CotH
MAFKDTDVEVPATMLVDGVKYPDVGLSFRGNSSFMMVPAGLKHSFNVTVDFAHEGQHLLGFRTLNLLNGNGDPSLLRGVLFHEIARNYLPSPGTNFARVVVNGESWGLFVNVEQLNRDFFERRLSGDNGTRWKVPGSPGGSRAGLEYLGEDIEAYRPLFEIKNKDNKRSWEALINLTRILNQEPADRLVAALEPVLDIDGALRFLALDNVLVNSDGYWTRGSDYFLYLDQRGRFHVLPNDTNETFSTGGGRGGPGGPGGPAGRGGRRGGAPGTGPQGGGPGGGGSSLDLLVGLEDDSKPLRSKLLAVPELRARYLEYCREIAATWLDWNRLGPVAERFHAAISPLVANDTRKLMTDEAFASSLEDLKRFVDARRAYVSNFADR